MGISRDSWHKRRASGAHQKPIRMKRKFELGRPPAMTKIGERRIRLVRCRGGNIKHRALRLDHGNFCWPGEAVTRKTRVLTVVYNAVSNELVRTNTLVKGAIVQIDSTPFKVWYQKHYGVAIGVKEEEKKKHARKLKKEAARKPKITKTAIRRATKRAELKKGTKTEKPKSDKPKSDKPKPDKPEKKKKEKKNCERKNWIKVKKTQK